MTTCHCVRAPVPDPPAPAPRAAPHPHPQVYHELLVHPPLLHHPNPKRVFIMGGERRGQQGGARTAGLGRGEGAPLRTSSPAPLGLHPCTPPGCGEPQGRYEREGQVIAHFMGCCGVDGLPCSWVADEGPSRSRFGPHLRAGLDSSLVFLLVCVWAGGEGATAREILRHPSVEQVVMVDIDKVRQGAGPTGGGDRGAGQARARARRGQQVGGVDLWRGGVAVAQRRRQCREGQGQRGSGHRAGRCAGQQRARLHGPLRRRRPKGVAVEAEDRVSACLTHSGEGVWPVSSVSSPPQLPSVCKSPVRWPCSHFPTSTQP